MFLFALLENKRRTKVIRGEITDQILVGNGKTGTKYSYNFINIII